MNIFEIITPQNIIAYWDVANEDQTDYLGERLFPARKVQGLELSMISGRSSVPVVLTPSAFDTQATYRDRVSVEIQKTKLPLYRERMRIDEETRQMILAVSNQDILRGYVERIFDDANNLRRGARAARELAAMQLITTGHVKISGNGVKNDYNYGMSKKQFVTPSINWGDTANSKPLQDLNDWVDYAQSNYNISLGYAVMSPRTFNLLKGSESLAYALYPTATNANKMFVTSQQAKDIVSATTGLTILINKSVYAETVGGPNKAFFPDGVVTLLPVGGVLGNTFFGTTPEEADLRARLNTNVQIIDTGVALFTRMSEHPVTSEVVCSQISLPAFSGNIEGGAGNIFIAKVD